MPAKERDIYKTLTRAHLRDGLLDGCWTAEDLERGADRVLRAQHVQEHERHVVARDVVEGAGPRRDLDGPGAGLVGERPGAHARPVEPAGHDRLVGLALG